MNYKIPVLMTTLLFSSCSNTKDFKSMNEKKTTTSGLSYEILKQGDEKAAVAQKNQRVSVHYTGWLDENGQPGKKFDSSVDRGEPFNFLLGVGYVIKGWDEGVAGMKVGEKRRLYIPANLGYGDRGVPGAIPARSGLIFDVELLGIS